MAATGKDEAKADDQTDAEVPGDVPGEADAKTPLRFSKVHIPIEGGLAIGVDSAQEIVSQMGAEFRQPPTFTITLHGRRGGTNLLRLNAEQMNELQMALRFELGQHGMEAQD